MNKTILAVSAALAILSSATSCTWVRVNPKLFGEDSQNSVRGVAVEQISQADSFVVNIPVDIEYTQTEAEPFLTIEASEKVRQKIEVLQDGRTVTIRVKPGERLGGGIGDINVKIGTSTLSSLTFNGAADFSIEGGLATSRLMIQSNGACEIDIDHLKAEEITVLANGASEVSLEGLDCGSVNVYVNGAGDVTLEGRCTKADLNIAGAGDIDASRLVSESLTTDVHGLGTVKRP